MIIYMITRIKRTAAGKKLLSLLLALVMVLGMLPATALAADAVASVRIYVSINDGNAFVEANDGSMMQMKMVTVSDKDEDNKLSVYDALVCAHEQFAPENADFETKTVSNKTTASKIWGISDSFSIYVNSIANMAQMNSLKGNLKYALSTSLANGDILSVGAGKLSIFAQGTTTITGYSVITVPMGKPFKMVLETVDWAQKAPNKLFSICGNAVIRYDKSGNRDVFGQATTDTNGIATFTLDQPGEYLFTSEQEGISSGACIVRVLENKPAFSDIHVGLADDAALGYSRSEANLLDLDGEKTIIIPDGAQLFYGRANSDMSHLSGDNIWWYAEKSADGTSWESAISGKRSLDGTTEANISLKNNPTKLRFFINDSQSEKLETAHLSDDVVVAIKRQVYLSELTTSGTSASDADFKTGSLLSLVPQGTTSATVTATVPADSNYSIYINGNNVESGTAATVSLDFSSGDVAVPVVVQKDGDGYVERSYQIIFKESKNEIKPNFAEQPDTTLSEYIVNDTKYYVKTLHAFATASGEVTYQWYSNTQNSTENGTPIEGATGSSFLPSTEVAGEFYYYCVATNTDSKVEESSDKTVTSNIAHVIVYEKPNPSLTWNMDIPNLPTDKSQLFGEHTKGFYYHVGDTNIAPVKVKINLPASLSDELASGKLTISNCYAASDAYHAYSYKMNVEGDKASFVPDINKDFGGTNYNVFVTVSFLGRSFLASFPSNDFLYIYVDRYTDDPENVVWKGSGSEADPYQLKTTEDLQALYSWVFKGHNTKNLFFQITSDITLPEKWEPIGGLVDPGIGHINNGKNVYAFQGTIDGAKTNGGCYTITVPENGKPLLGHVQGAMVKNLNIYGKKIAGYGLVNNLEGVGLEGSAIVIDNVTLKTGTQTLKAGLIGTYMTNNIFAGCSAGFVATIRNCTVEKGVVIGYDGKESMIGSFAGRLVCKIENCVSYADVRGVNYVGGLVGTLDNAMGICEIKGCTFDGTVTATGEYAGGIVGGGYSNQTAPNGNIPHLIACTARGTIQGADRVGGILGGDPFVAQSWSTHTIQDNSFNGKVNATKGTYVGGVIGYYAGLNKYDNILNNQYNEDCGAQKGIGFVKYVDTNCNTHETSSGAIYFSTENGVEECPLVSGCNWKAQHNRTDDPLGVDSFKLAHTGGTEPFAYKLETSGTYKTVYSLGDSFSFDGLTLTATFTDGTTETVDPAKVTVIGFDNSTRGNQSVTLKYGPAYVVVTITMLAPAGEDITVTFSLLGDTAHGEIAEPHGLTMGGLTEWIPASEYTLSNNATVKDLLERALEEKGMIYENPSGNYIESITWNGTTLGEFDNGALSGWMYTIDGRHPDLGVNQQYLQDGNVIVLHYTDDYTKEAQDEGSGELPENKTDLTEAYTETAGYLAGAAEKNAPIVGSIGGEWMVIGLARDGKLTKNVADAYYANVEAYVKANINEKEQLHKNKSTDNARVILALTAMGKDVTNVQGHNLLAGFTDMAYISKQGINGPIWALIALDSHDYEIPESCKITRQQLVEAILAAQLSDGGWNLSGETADADVTAMALQALVPYTSDEKVMAAVEKGIDGLSELQLDNGGFGSWGTANSESCAQVIVALTALGIDPAADARFIKNDKTVLNAFAAFAVKDGFAHAADQNGNLQHNQMATEQAFYAMVAYNRFKSGENDLYNMLDVVLEKNTTEYPAEDPKDDPAPGVKEDLTEGISVAELNAAIQGKTEITVKAGDSTITLSAAVVKKLYETAPNAKLQIKVKALKVEELSTAEKATVSKLEGAMILDITAYLVEDGKDPIAVHELGGNVTVTAPYTQRVPVGKELVTYYIDSDGKQSDGIATTSANGLASFTTNHFSHYVIAQVDAPQAPVTGDSGHVLLWVTLMFAAGIGVVATTVLGKKRKYTR